MKTEKINRKLLRSYLRVAEFSRNTTQEEYDYLATNTDKLRDDLRKKFLPQFVHIADVAYERVRLGDNLENVLSQAIPLGDFELPRRIYLSKESYVNFLNYLCIQLFYVKMNREYPDSFPVENNLLESWYSGMSNYYVSKLEKSFKKDGIDFELFERNESPKYVNSEDYDAAFKKLIDVYVPESLY